MSGTEDRCTCPHPCLDFCFCAVVSSHTLTKLKTFLDLFGTVVKNKCDVYFIPNLNIFICYFVLRFLNNAASVASLRTTVVAVAAFLDAFQKVADLATNSRGR